MKTKLEKAWQKHLSSLGKNKIANKADFTVGYITGHHDGSLAQKRLDAAALKREATESERGPAKRKARA